ncbi:hypothetical protein [Saccharospirillum salsuginis]|uniref:WD40 repeat domain-containing protein n=1 Tax=Saccharospirillum salsuginis TaxID=418750 RepID=A0A918NHI1_9GAMM|nr:hypothetical protein [Saccharospirillum salsuginis]GGX70880.1 hypothetical protein GCM10007392_42950 [Saccharospirillum salsuginis]
MKVVRLLLLCLLIGPGSLIAPAVASPPDVGRDWQLPFVVTDDFLAFADTTGTVIEYTDGESVRLHAGHRGFPPVHEPPLLFATGVDGRVSAWHLEERRLLWQRRFEGWMFPPLVQDEAIFISGQPHRLFKLDRDSGSTLATAPLPNEAVYSPLSWRDGRIAIGVYARHWLVLEPEHLRETDRYRLPAPAITASPDGFYLSQNGHLHRRLNTGEFELRRQGKSPVRWFQRVGDELSWADDGHWLNVNNRRLRCLDTGAPVVHWQPGSNRDRITITHFNGTSRTLLLSDQWGNPDLQADKENTNEKMVDANQLSTDRHHDQLRPC